MLADINGTKPPNRLGQDRFIFEPEDVGSSSCSIKTLPDCLSSSNCLAATSNGISYTDICPSADSHPCYYRSWIMN